MTDPMFGGGDLTPEQIQALMDYGAGQGAFSEQDRAIQQQLAQAVALRNQRSAPHTTGAGAMYGGMGDVLNQITSMRQEKMQRAADMELQQGRINALKELAARYGRGQPQMQGQPGAGFVDPSVAAIYARRQQQANPYYLDPGSGGD